MAVDGDDAVGILIYYDTVRIHTEGTHGIFEFLGSVYDLTLIQFISQMREDDSGKLHADTDIHTVGLGVDIQILTDLFHPFAATAAYGDDALVTLVGGVLAADAISRIQCFHSFYRSIEIESHFIFEFCVQILQHDKVDIGT